MKRSFLFQSAFVTFLASSLAIQMASGQTPTTWSGADSDQWENSDNWNNGVPDSDSFNALFTNSGANRDIELTEARSINRFELESTPAASYSFSGSQLTLSSSGNTGTNAAMRITDTSVVFNNNVHFSAAAGGFMDFTTAVSPNQTDVEFAGNLSANNTLSTLGRNPANPVSVTISGNFISEQEINWQTSNSTLTLTGSNSFTTLTIQRSTNLQLGSAGALAAGSTLNSNIGAGFSVEVEAQGADRTYAANVRLNAATGLDTSFVGDHNLTFTGNVLLARADSGDTISNGINVSAPRLELVGNWEQAAANRSVRKEGAGILVMGENATTTHTYQGATIVNAGTLLVNGNLQNVSGDLDVVTVNNTATLGGTGIISRNTTIGSEAFLAPGDEGTGILTVSNADLALNGSLQIELGGTGVGDFDSLALSGTGTWALTNSDLELSLVNSFSPSLNDQFVIVTSTQNLGADFWGSSISMGLYEFAINYTAGDGNDIMLTVTAIPEPATGTLIMAVGIILLAVRRNFRKS